MLWCLLKWVRETSIKKPNGKSGKIISIASYFPPKLATPGPLHGTDYPVVGTTHGDGEEVSVRHGDLGDAQDVILASRLDERREPVQVPLHRGLAVRSP